MTFWDFADKHTAELFTLAILSIFFAPIILAAWRSR